MKTHLAHRPRRLTGLSIGQNVEIKTYCGLRDFSQSPDLCYSLKKEEVTCPHCRQKLDQIRSSGLHQ